MSPHRLRHACNPVLLDSADEQPVRALWLTVYGRKRAVECGRGKARLIARDLQLSCARTRGVRVDLREIQFPSQVDHEFVGL